MSLKTRKRRHKLDRLLSTLSAQDQDEFHTLCQFNPPYRCIQAWFKERGCEISVNGIFCWWQSTFPNADESRILRGIGIELGRDFDMPPYTSVLRLATMAAQVLSDHATSKLDAVAPHTLMETQLELFVLVRSLSMLSRPSNF